MNNKITFLFGAGISIPAGLPSGNQLTQRILANDRIFRHSSGVYFQDGEFPAYKEHGHFFRVLNEINQYLVDNGTPEPSYEDIFDICYTLSHKSDKVLIDKLADINEFDLKDSAELCNYFNFFIYGQLATSRSLKYFDNMINFCKNKSKINYFTLNHDLLLERVLSNHKFDYVNGFDKQKGDVRFWDMSTYQNQSQFKIYKLHGSIDWYKYDNHFPVMACKGDYNHVKDDSGRDLGAARNAYPHFLNGTTTKIGLYDSGPHKMLLELFEGNLDQTDVLIVSGYAYGDKGINKILTKWQTKRPNAEIINISRSKEYKGLGLRVEHKDKWFDEFTEDDWNDLGL